ncbi:MAG: ATP synthase F1 subunit epsilon [Candidatus Daviesbacteria bacterium]|nr:ATP synthase F1 subunit epsilon [Candidatus Daviesbacteria bacterium]
MSKLHLKIVTPEKAIFDDEISEVVATTDNGEIGILPEHISLMTQVLPGEVRIKQGNKEIIMVVGLGLLQVAQNNVIITTDMAQKYEDIDEKSAEEAKKRAQLALEQTLTDEEIASTTAALEKAIAQLNVKRKHKVR